MPTWLSYIPLLLLDQTLAFSAILLIGTSSFLQWPLLDLTMLLLITIVEICLMAFSWFCLVNDLHKEPF